MAWPQAYGENPVSLTYVPADSTLVLAGHDLAEQAQCIMPTGSGGFASGTSNTGFSDTTYLPTTAQLLHQTTTGMY